MPALLFNTQLVVGFLLGRSVVFITTCHIEESFEEKSVIFFPHSNRIFSCVKGGFYGVVCNLSLKTPSCYKDTHILYMTGFGLFVFYETM